MLDLYARLGVGFGADENGLRRALAAGAHPELKRRVEGVLLNPPNRAEYDAVLPTLRGLHALREALRLDDAGWAETPVLGDFHGGAPIPLSEPAPVAPPPRAGLRRWWPFG